MAWPLGSWTASPRGRVSSRRSSSSLAASELTPVAGMAPASPVVKYPTCPSRSTANQHESIEWAAGKSLAIGKALEAVAAHELRVPFAELADEVGVLFLPTGPRADRGAVARHVRR